MLAAHSHAVLLLLAPLLPAARSWCLWRPRRATSWWATLPPPTATARRVEGWGQGQGQGQGGGRGRAAAGAGRRQGQGGGRGRAWGPAELCRVPASSFLNNAVHRRRPFTSSPPCWSPLPAAACRTSSVCAPRSSRRKCPWCRLSPQSAQPLPLPPRPAPPLALPHQPAAPQPHPPPLPIAASRGRVWAFQYPFRGQQPHDLHARPLHRKMTAAQLPCM